MAVDEAGELVGGPSRRAGAPDAERFDVLYRRYATRALHLAGLLCGGDRHRAEDVVADAMVRVLPRWRAGAIEDFWPYLRTAVVNQVRGRARREATARRWLVRQQPAAPEDACDAELIARQDLAGVLRGLPDLQRQVVVLRYAEDLSEAETARILGCPVGTVKSSASRGVVQLRRLLGEEVSDGF